MGIPFGIQWNPQEFDIPTILAESEWNSNILWESAGICWNSWRRVKYCPQLRSFPLCCNFVAAYDAHT